MNDTLKKLLAGAWAGIKANWKQFLAGVCAGAILFGGIGYLAGFVKGCQHEKKSEAAK